MGMRFCFIGTRDMGGALTVALAKTVSFSDIYLENPTWAKVETLAVRIGVTVTDNAAIAQSCKYIMLGVKPQVMEETLSALRPVLAVHIDAFVLVSMAAELSAATIQKYVGSNYLVICIILNTPVGVGEGVICLPVHERYGRRSPQNRSAGGKDFPVCCADAARIGETDTWIR